METQEVERRKRIGNRMISGLVAGGIISVGGLLYSGYNLINDPHSGKPEVRLYHQAETTLSTLQAERERIQNEKNALPLPYMPEGAREDIEAVYSLQNQGKRLEHMDKAISAVRGDLEDMRQEPNVQAESNHNRFWNNFDSGSIVLGFSVMGLSMLYGVVNATRRPKKPRICGDNTK